MACNRTRSPMKTCSVSGCNGPHYAKGFCNKHWSRMRRNGCLSLKADPAKTCRVSNCGGKHLAKGLCRKHYLRKYRTGSLNTSVLYGETALNRVLSKVVKTQSGCWEYTGKLTPKGYAHVKSDDGKMRFAHRIVFEAYIGPVPEGKEVDHLCRNRSCCNPDHLEAVTHQENCRRGNAGHDHAKRPRNHLGQFSSEKGLI
ncbi:HNH endonuclease signature motif containing protein [Roseovarius confluentis]|uniref:HNH endonuclease signature motif containing protein n=1 Tax=Roseovarius TaxID=74030 RepID=UPI003C7DA18A